MPKFVKSTNQPIAVVSTSIPDQQITSILSTPGIYHPGHHIYPANQGNRRGNHLDALFLIEPIASNNLYVDWITEDINRWIEEVGLQYDVIFAPAQPAVKSIVKQLSQRTGTRQAYWEYLSSGWFGDHLVEGQINAGERVLVFNGVTQQGRCVGERLPSFVKALGGITVAAAVFARGTADGVKQAQKHYGKNFYSTIEVKISIDKPEACRQCQHQICPAIPWTDVRDSNEQTSK